MPTPKVGLFGTPSKIDPKIRKISKFQTALEIALVNGFWWNLVQMKGLGLFFQDFLKFWIFINFSMFSTYLNMTKIRIFGKYQKHRKSMVRGQVFEKFGNFFWKFFQQLFSPIHSQQFVNARLLITTLDQKLWLKTWIEISDFQDFPDFPI